MACTRQDKVRLSSSGAANSKDTPLRRLQQWQEGKTPGPWTITLMPTNRCNLRCAMCWQRAFDDTVTNPEMPDERILRLLDEAAEMGVRAWNLSGGGEPLVRANLVVAFCEKAIQRGMTGVLQTNATLLKQDIAERLVATRWPEMLVSLDGPDSSVNDAIRSSGCFEKAVGAIRLMNEIKRKSGSLLPKIGLHTVVTRLNYDRLAAMVDLAHSLECTKIEISGVFANTPQGMELRLGPEEAARLNRYLVEAAARAEAVKLPHNFESMLVASETGGAAYAAPRVGTEASIASAVCFEPWLSLTIHVDGRVSPCCLIWEEAADNIETRTLQEVWTGPFLSKVRERFSRGISRPECAQCLSSIQARNHAFKSKLELKSLGPRARFAVLAAKGWGSLRRHGLRKTCTRAMEWMRIGNRW